MYDDLAIQNLVREVIRFAYRDVEEAAEKYRRLEEQKPEDVAVKDYVYSEIVSGSLKPAKVKVEKDIFTALTFLCSQDSDFYFDMLHMEKPQDIAARCRDIAEKYEKINRAADKAKVDRVHLTDRLMDIDQFSDYIGKSKEQVYRYCRLGMPHNEMMFDIKAAEGWLVDRRYI